MLIRVICNAAGKPSGVVYWYVTADGYINDMFVSYIPGFTSYSDANITQMLYISARLAGLSKDGAKQLIMNTKIGNNYSVVTSNGRYKIDLDLSAKGKKRLYYMTKWKLPA